MTYRAWNHEFNDYGLCVNCDADFMDVEGVNCPDGKKEVTT